MLVTGCRFGFFEHDDKPSTDGAIAGDGAIDGISDVDRNIQLGAWGPATLSEVSSSTDPDDDPTLTGDQLEVYIDSGRFVTGGASGDVWMATRASTSDPFGTPTVVSQFLSLADDSTGDLSTNGLRFYLGSDRRTSGDRDIWVAERADRQSPWGALVRVPELSADSINDSGVCESADGLSLIFGSERTGNGDLFFTTRPSLTSPWGLPIPIASLNTAEEESQQWCNGALTLIYFSRRNAGGNLDIWFASRANASLPFDAPQMVSELATSVDDADPWVSPDLRTMYFYRGSGTGDIYVSKR